MLQYFRKYLLRLQACWDSTYSLICISMLLITNQTRNHSSKHPICTSAKVSQEQRQFKGCCGIYGQIERLSFLPLLEHHQARKYSHVPPEHEEVQGNTLDDHTIVSSSISLEERTPRRVTHFGRPLHHYSIHSSFPNINHSTSCFCHVSSWRNRKLICLLNFQRYNSSALLSLCPHTGICLMLAEARLSF